MREQDPSKINKSVISAIKSGKVHMRPRAYFTLLGFVSIGAVVLAGVATAYLMSIMSFWVRIQMADTMAYGARANLRESIASFPWWALVAAAILLVLAIVLVRHHGKMYKHKVSTVAIVLIICSLILGLGLSFLDVGKSHTSNRMNGRGQNQSWQRGY